MFNRDFYPTNADTGEAMLAGLDLSGKKAWEPEGGKGDLVRMLQARGAEVISTESDDRLRLILQTICPVIGTDMLKVTSDQISHVDYIVMNPPFSRGAEHLLHAWKIAPAGCKLISLLNAETLKNAYSKSREELKEIVQTYGDSQNIGSAFKEAERSTDVETVIVRLDKPGEASQEFAGFFMEEDQEAQADGLIPYNIVRDLVNRYVESVRIFDQQLETAVRLNELQADYFDSGLAELSISVSRLGAPVKRNVYKKEMQRQGWRWIFSRLNMDKHTTRGLRQDINKFVETQQDVPFTMRNIYRMLDIVIQTTGQRMDKAILEMFERVTQHTHENRYSLEGWQTNSHYLLMKRFILPNMAAVDKYHEGNKLTNTYGSYFDLMEDMAKALCFLTGKNYDQMANLSTVCKADGVEYGTWFEWAPFFRVKAHKKGTMHFEFIEDSVWQSFNARIAKILGYPLHEHKAQTKWQQSRQGKNSPDGPQGKTYKVMETIKI